jgi:hypothetical protein
MHEDFILIIEEVLRLFSYIYILKNYNFKEYVFGLLLHACSFQINKTFQQLAPKVFNKFG